MVQPQRSRNHPDRRLIGEIETRLDAVERALAGYEELVQERDRLRRARAALLGEPARAVGAPKRISQEDVAAFLARAPGSKPGEIAAALGANQPTISSHLYRGKSGPFVSRKGRWYLRSQADNHSGGSTVHTDPTTPEGLANELGIDPRTLRAWLRERFPRSESAKNTRWDLGRREIEAARSRWAKSS
jgi:hypothetical protein